MTQITIEGNNVTNLETLVRRVAYINVRDFPTPGRRPVSLATSIQCTSGKSLRVGTAESHVVVQQPRRPSVIINGTDNFAREYDAFRLGLRVFPDVSVFISPSLGSIDPEEEPVDSAERKDIEEELDENLDEERRAPGNGVQLDECSVSVYPPLNPDHETLVLPDSLVAELGLAATVTRQGATIGGADTTAHYQAVLRYIRYVCVFVCMFFFI